MKHDELSALILRLTDPDEGVRLYAVDDLLESGDPACAPALADRLAEEPSAAVLDAIVFALRNLENPAAYDRIFALLQSPDAALRSAAVLLFGGYGPEAAGYLSARFHESGTEVRKSILDALARARLPPAVEVVHRAFEDSDPNIRIAAVEYAAGLGDRASVPRLIELFRRSEEPMLRASVLAALNELEAHREAIELYRELKKSGGDPSPFLDSVMTAFGHAGSPAELLALAVGLEDPAPYAEELLSAFTLALERDPEFGTAPELCGIVRAMVKPGRVPETVVFGAVQFLRRAGGPAAEACLREIVSRIGDPELERFIRASDRENGGPRP